MCVDFFFFLFLVLLFCPARETGITGARGVAGTVLVHKVAGAAAQRGMSLEEVVNVASCFAARVGTLGVALGAVVVVVVWCGVVWCGVVWCGVVWCGVW